MANKYIKRVNLIAYDAQWDITLFVWNVFEFTNQYKTIIMLRSSRPRGRR